MKLMRIAALPILWCGPAFLILLGTVCPKGATAAGVAPPLIPTPQHVQLSDARLDLGGGLSVLSGGSGSRVAEIEDLLGEGLAQLGVKATVSPAAVTTGVRCTLRLSSAAVPAEAYQLKIGDDVTITASDPRGLLWGVQTLLQSVETVDGRPTLRRGEVADQPARGWRGLMIDPVRSWLDLGFVRRTIRVMSAYKLNVLHVHLIDDQAWRFESHAWPKCNRPGEPLYTQAELRALVAYAARYGVEIVPEFDVPGHSMTAVNAYPELDCEHHTRTMNEAILCSGRPFTWEFIDKLVAEAAEIFPSKYIHLGGDEPYAIKRWATCPDCQARMKEKGATSLDGLYHTFVTDLDAIAKRHGKTLIVWNDALHAGVEPMPPKDIIVDDWVNWESVGPLAEAGYTMLNSSSGPLYLTSFGLREGLPLSTILSWDATRFAHPRAKRTDTVLTYQPLSPKATILGGHAAAWATEQRMTERRLYPRLLAFAEDLWSEGHPHDAAEFQARFDAGHVARLRKLGVPDDDALPVEKLTAADGRSVRAYRDFILSFDVKMSATAEEMGLTIRSARAGQGIAIRAAPPPGWIMTKGLVSGRAWNHIEVVAHGPVVALTINGGLAWSVADATPVAGAIIFQSPGPGYEYRDVQVRNLEGIP